MHQPEERYREFLEAGVSEDEAVQWAAQLQEMLRSPGWQAYRELLKRLRISYREWFEDAADLDEIRKIQGVLKGLALAEDVPEEVARYARAQVERERKREEQQAASRRTHTIGGGEETF